jgi:hypothetical protein
LRPYPPLLRCRSVLLGLVLFGPAVPARAESISALSPPRPAGLGPRDLLAWIDGASQAGACQAAPADADAPLHQDRKDETLLQLPLATLLRGPLTGVGGGAGMGASPGGVDAGSAGQELGLCSSLPRLDVQLSGRLVLVCIYSLPCPFPSGVFHPPRDA